MVRSTCASAPALRPIRLVNSANASRSFSSIPARAKFLKRFTASVGEQPPSPLAGKRVVITRAQAQSAPLAAALKAHGAEVIALPLIQILPPMDYAALDGALRDLRKFDWLIFTSQNAVTGVSDRLAFLLNATGAPTPVIPSVA